MTTIDRNQLVESAKDFADRALTAYTEDDRRMILQNAAISLEHLSKAYLANLNPVLLMEIKNGQFESLLYLADLSDKIKKAKHPRTISAREARTRVEYLIRGITVPKAQLDQLIDIRDGVIHIGHLAEANTREILTAYLRFANILYDELRIPVESRWASHAALVESLISRSATEIEHEVQRKIAAAKRHFFEFWESIPEETQENVVSALQAEWPKMLPDEDHTEPIACPACTDISAKVFGTIETAYDGDTLEDGYPTIIISDVVHTLHARRIVCGLCKLHLDNPDELKAAGVPTSWVIEDSFDPSDFDLPR